MPKRPADSDQSVLALPADLDLSRLAIHEADRGSVEWVEYEPGNMTRYRLYSVALPSPPPPGGDALIALTIPTPLAAAHEFNTDASASYAIHVGYVAAKLNLVRHRAGPADILPVARIVAWLLGRGLEGARDYAGEDYESLRW